MDSWNNISLANCQWKYRQALRYLIRNTSLPQRVRAQAQLQLSQMHCYTRFTQIKNRCIMGGKGRGIFSDFRLSRVSDNVWDRRVLLICTKSAINGRWSFAQQCTCNGFSANNVVLVVSIPNECLVWEFTWREESELVGVGMAAYESRPLGSSLAWDMYIRNREAQH
jgi:ribosomal protein S14